MARKSGHRFSDQAMLEQSMARKSGHRFSDRAMLEQNMVWDALTVFC